MENEAYVRAVHDKGFTFDRRRLLAVAGGTGALALTGLWPGGAEAAAAEACLEEVESETAGPFPADGSNGPDVRTINGVVRRDIRSSFGGATGVAGGVPLTFSLVVQDLTCKPLVGAAVYAWHCDREGRYSLYSSGATEENYLRGIQVTDRSGRVTFTSIFPACYQGRWPHIHFEVYSTLTDATGGAGPIRKTSQIAFPEQVADAVYATAAGYEQSVANMERISLATDMVFRDDLAAREMATVTGDVDCGYVARLTITVDPANVEEPGEGPPPPPVGGATV
ncbi:dioxygenase family protein [Paractinoplanes atraurantiacus]|uniref:Protocatechuate 3,4-dioxygenase beta subunit n=1 Tax=Paractinoplanes atraurantiacus TaxID=1036182 RepID=A0A285K9I9_9ACTN|nr:intradiol ring-cleavage dioxygenase [Actinoplanes atraurantiacus]SNY69294.1 Protocatechuate 3,4-dioxygenase beta subunit [Actinoplanes atraurantiacus]